jgi:hypothetical protein
MERCKNSAKQQCIKYKANLYRALWLKYDPYKEKQKQNLDNEYQKFEKYWGRKQEGMELEIKCLEKLEFKS